MVKVVNDLKAEVAGLKGELTSQRDKVLKPVLSTYLNDYYESKFEGVKSSLPKKAQEKIDLESVMKHAEANGLKDKSGRLDLRKAAHDMSEEFIIEEKVESRLATERKKFQDEQTLAAIQKPGSGPRGGPAKSFINEKGKVKNFDEVLVDAANDADLWAGLTRNQA
jgi:hypothetical protein